MLAATCWSASRPIWISWASETSESCRRPVAGLVAQEARSAAATRTAAAGAGPAPEHRFTLGVAFPPRHQDVLEELGGVGLGAQAVALAVEPERACLARRACVRDAGARAMAGADVALLAGNGARRGRRPIGRRGRYARRSHSHLALL